MTKQYKWTNIILGVLIGIVATAVYIMTAEPTASWWDCGEYISTDYKLLVGHPPGAPTFQLIGRVASLFAAGDVTKVAFCVNSLAALCSGLTIMFLFWTITMLGRKLVAKSGEMTTGRMIAVFGSALVGSLAYTFSDTFWFSAVEGEVYAMSSFFTALVFWCILKWDFEYDNPKSNTNPNRWIVLITYLIGLSIGVHLLNLLTIPAIVLIVYFKLSKKATSMGVALTTAILSFFGAIILPTPLMFAVWLLVTLPLTILCFKKGTFHSLPEWGVLFSLIGSFVLVGLVLYFIVPNVVNFAGKFEIFFVNSVGMPFNSGAVIFFILLGLLIACGLYFGYKKRKQVLLVATYCLFFLLIGYSTFFVLVIRSNANPTIDENNPEDAVSLLAYLNREQYGETPFLFGPTFNSHPTGTEEGDPVYARDNAAGKYVVVKRPFNYTYGNQEQFLTRMWSQEERYKSGYVEWGFDSKDLKKKERAAAGSYQPNFEDNKKFLMDYQFNYMYFRYFMWNFSGRQNAIQGMGDGENGNWITGIPAFDRARLGDQATDVASMKNKGTNKYYMLPLLLGLIGLVFYFFRDSKNSFIVLLLFLMTGLAIAFYLNMQAYQPRERDYAFVGSFYAFCIWVGFGVYAIYSLFEKINNKVVQIAAPAAITVLCLFLVPGIMARENWDDHDRSNRYTALAAAKAYLDSCEPNAILYTMGDNDTFPIWYAQEVEGYRTDVRNCNLSLLSAGWYVDQMKRKAYESKPLPIDFTWEQYRDGTRDVVLLNGEVTTAADLKAFLKDVKSEAYDGKTYFQLDNYGKKFYLDVNKDQVVKTKTVRGDDVARIVPRIEFELKSPQISRSTLMVLEMIAENNWERPIYFAASSIGDFGLDKYLQNEGFAYRLVPVQKGCTTNTAILYDNIMNKFDDHTRPDIVKNPEAAKGHQPYEYAWGGVNDPRVYNPEENIHMALSISSMHVQLAEDLIREYSYAANADNLYKLKRAEEILDHLQVVLPDKLIPFLNNKYHQYTMYFINGADCYADLAGIYAEQGRTQDAERVSKKAQVIKNQILKEISEQLSFYENAKNKDKVMEIHQDNIEWIYSRYLPMLSEGSNELTKNIPVAGTFKKAYEEASNMLADLEKGVANFGHIISQLENAKALQNVGGSYVYHELNNPEYLKAVTDMLYGDYSIYRFKQYLTDDKYTFYGSKQMAKFLTKNGDATVANQGKALDDRFKACEAKIDTLIRSMSGVKEAFDEK